MSKKRHACRLRVLFILLCLRGFACKAAERSSHTLRLLEALARQCRKNYRTAGTTHMSSTRGRQSSWSCTDGEYLIYCLAVDRLLCSLGFVSTKQILKARCIFCQINWDRLTA